MNYTEHSTSNKAKTDLVQDRIYLLKDHKDKLKDYEERLGIPKSAIVRMALDSFFPKISNSGYSEKGIRANYLNSGLKMY